MRVAVIITGQPRHMEHGAWWMNTKVFPKFWQGIKVDYYVWLWDNGDPELGAKVEKAYKPVKYHIENYQDSITNFISKVQEQNLVVEQCKTDLVQKSLQDNILFNTPKITEWGKNFWGQFIAASRASNLFGDMTNNYDVVIRTRTDTVFNPMEERLWIQAFHNLGRNTNFHNKLFSPWMHLASGSGFMGDFAHIGKPGNIHNFYKNMEEHCLKVAGPDRPLFYELNVIHRDRALVAHWMWTKLSHYSSTDWLSFGVVWPCPFDTSVIRYDYPIGSVNDFNHFRSEFHRFEKEFHHHK